MPILAGGCTSGSSIIKRLEKNDLVGGKLLDLAFVLASISDLPVSPETVMVQTRVEALAISAYNLKRVVSKFRLHFSLNFPDLEHSQSIGEYGSFFLTSSIACKSKLQH